MAQPTTSSVQSKTGWEYLKAFIAGGLGRLSEALNVQSTPASDPVVIQDTPPPASGSKIWLWAVIGLAVLIIALVVWKRNRGVAG